MHPLNEPLTFSPLLKRIIWGGRRLGERLGKSIGDGADYAESWEFVDRTADQSVVDQGPWTGQAVSALLKTHRRELLGRNSGFAAFPLLLKYLDCNRVLSVQVHPADGYALKMSPPDLGKTEAWYIVEASPESVIYAGLRKGVDRDALENAVRTGKTESVLHSFQPVAGQCVFIPAGTVHALGDGLLVAEVQQSSDTTFRLFDWNRVDASGRERPLHIEQSLDVTDYERGPIRPQTPILCADRWESLVRCDKFSLRRAAAPDNLNRQLTTGGDDSPVLLMVTGGGVTIAGNGWAARQINAGQTVVLPASLGETTLELRGEEANVLEIRLP